MSEKKKILNIAMNLNRVGNWAADDFDKKRGRIKSFLNQTTDYIGTVQTSKLKEPFKRTYDRFLQDYPKLDKEAQSGTKNSDIWAEKAMTWGNILTHRSKLIDPHL